MGVTSSSNLYQDLCDDAKVQRIWNKINMHKESLDAEELSAVISLLSSIFETTVLMC